MKKDINTPDLIKPKIEQKSKGEKQKPIAKIVADRWQYYISFFPFIGFMVVGFAGMTKIEKLNKKHWRYGFIHLGILAVATLFCGMVFWLISNSIEMPILIIIMISIVYITLTPLTMLSVFIQNKMINKHYSEQEKISQSENADEILSEEELHSASLDPLASPQDDNPIFQDDNPTTH